MKVSLTTLSENTAILSRGKAEWGLSILVQIDDRAILFDTGASSILLDNAATLGVRLDDIEQIVLSHGHYDHTGGLAALLDAIGGRPVIAHPDIWEKKYSRKQAGTNPVDIGIPFCREELEAKGAVFHLTTKPCVLGEGIMTTGEVPMSSPWEGIEPGLLVEREGQLMPDPLADDLSLVINSPQGLIVILGCAHRGIINHLRQAQKITGESRIFAVVGGTHLMAASEDRIERTIIQLKEFKIQKIGVSHCTGFKAANRIYSAFDEGFFPNNAGTTWQVLG